MNTSHHKDLIKWFEKNNGKYHTFDLFKDVLALISLTFQQSTNKLIGDNALWEKKESEYLDIVRRYDKELIDKTPEVLGIILSYFEHNISDFLGECFMELGLGNKHTGQFFTPYHVSKMCALLTNGREDIIDEKGFILVNDPAVGMGSMPIGVVDAMRDFDYNPQNQMFFIGGDVDRRVLDGCFIQMTLLGIPTKLYHQNALSLETLGDDMINVFWYLNHCDYKIKESTRDQNKNKSQLAMRSRSSRK